MRENEYVDTDGVVHVVEGDRVVGGPAGAGAGSQNSVPLKFVGYGGALILLVGTGLGYLIFPHGQTGPTTTTTTTAAGKPQTETVREALTREQELAALNGGPQAIPGVGGTSSIGLPGATGVVANPLQPGIPVGYQPGQPGVPGQPGQPATSQKPIDPRVALDLATRRSPIMGFAGASFGQGASAPQGGANGQQGTGGRSSFARYDGQGSGNDDSQGSQGSQGGQGGQGGDGQGTGAGGSGGQGGQRGQDGLSSQLNHQAIETVRATVVNNRSFLLSAGTLVPCTLQTAINSTQAGYVSCVIGHDVYSEDGRIVLLDKGTKVLGQYTGGVNQGQARLFVLWTRALTPRGVSVDLGSPASDDLGRAGMSGGVDSQFFARFGGALMLSVIEDLGAVASSRVARVGTNTTQVPQNTASTALQSTINIKPVLKKNQGEQVAIFVAKDFDFSPIYDVRLKR